MEFICMTGFYRGEPTESKSEYGMKIERTAIGHNPHRINVSSVAERGWSERGAMVYMEPHMAGKGRSSLVDAGFQFAQTNVV